MSNDFRSARRTEPESKAGFLFEATILYDRDHGGARIQYGNSAKKGSADLAWSWCNDQQRKAIDTGGENIYTSVVRVTYDSQGRVTARKVVAERKEHR